jgi:hypothetical protein
LRVVNAERRVVCLGQGRHGEADREGGCNTSRTSRIEPATTVRTARSCTQPPQGPTKPAALHTRRLEVGLGGVEKGTLPGCAGHGHGTKQRGNIGVRRGVERQSGELSEKNTTLGSAHKKSQSPFFNTHLGFFCLRFFLRPSGQSLLVRAPRPSKVAPGTRLPRPGHSHCPSSSAANGWFSALCRPPQANRPSLSRPPWPPWQPQSAPARFKR